jgi:hypothetical protein
MDELGKLLEKYQAANPEAENPFNFFSYLGDEGLIDMLKKALKEGLILEAVEDGIGPDQGEVTLIKKP